MAAELAPDTTGVPQSRPKCDATVQGLDSSRQCRSRCERRHSPQATSLCGRDGRGEGAVLPIFSGYQVKLVDKLIDSHIYDGVHLVGTNVANRI